jgi:hypothetical protein
MLCLHLNQLIVIIITLNMSSDYSLTPPPASPEPELPVLPRGSQSKASTPSSNLTDIPKSNAYILYAAELQVQDNNAFNKSYKYR